MTVDAHCHASTHWYEPIDTLLYAMDRCSVDRAVLVQMLDSTDSTDMIAARRAHPDRLRFIAAIDPAAPDAVCALDTAVAAGAVGLRMRSTWRSAGTDPLDLWRAIAGAGLCVSMVGPASSFIDGSLTEIATACPDLTIVLEHLGGLARPDVGDRDALLPLVCAIAVHPNIALKVTGLGQVAPKRPDLDEATPPLDLAAVPQLFGAIIAAFGANRLMWGSDFPPVAAREGYANALGWTRALFEQNWPETVTDIFGGNAVRTFGW
jgi:L-fuconolactonase